LIVETERARRPFWIHQIVEYMIGIALIAAAIQQPKPAVPAVMGLPQRGHNYRPSWRIPYREPEGAPTHSDA